MLTVFNRRLLCEYLNSEDSAAVWKKLREAGIEYSVKKCNSAPSDSKPAVRMARSGRTGNFTSNSSASNAITVGVPASWSGGVDNSASYLYSIYVSKKDLAAAQQIISK